MFPMDLTRRAMIIYTSGTTGKPKGVVSTHSNIEAQVKSLVDRWRWSSNDKILHVLPLHHMHGILNALTCALYSGATVEMLPKFNPQDVWNRFMDQKRDLSLFMAVPTIYSKLVDYYQTKLTPSQQQDATRACSQFRVMISGSAALPVPLLNAWIDISGQVLLERYGLTEIGMALSGGYEIEKRITGCVGVPLPGVQIRLIAEDGTDVTNKIEEPGEIQVKGSNVFKEYWNRPEATMKEFTEDGWFKTGDIALRTPVHHQFKILGRKSVDIIKSGGYKISAIEVEHELGAHPDIMEVAVLGIDDQDWGQRVGAIIVPKDQNTNLDLAAIREFARQRLASYKIPTILKVYKNELPRNPMGKLNKKELENFF
ncbi:hypothetical protein G9A89_010882 [Geosiphon pyriformis]|nr:hypothetical protein G9A89_010882 [Geosiphon pyriformis]